MQKLENIQKEYQKYKPFINKCQRKEENYPSGKDGWKKIEKNNKTIALNMLYVKKNTYSAYISIRSLNYENHINLLSDFN